MAPPMLYAMMETGLPKKRIPKNFFHDISVSPAIIQSTSSGAHGRITAKANTTSNLFLVRNFFFVFSYVS